MNPYDILGIPQGSSSDDIKKAYRKQAMKHHPDKGGDPDEFKKVQSAYEKLTNPEVNGSNPEDMMANVFRDMMANGFGFPGQQAQNQHTVSMTLREAFFGKSLTIRTSEKIACPQCRCSTCTGTGIVMQMIFQTQCPACRGSKGTGCSTCSGTGSKNIEKTTTIGIPPGMSNESPPIQFEGNLIKILVVNSDNFILDGRDFIFTQPLTFKESILGKTFTIPLFTGDIEYTSGYIKYGKKYVIKGGGLPPNGNVIIKFDIECPSEYEIEKIKLIP